MAMVEEPQADDMMPVFVQQAPPIATWTDDEADRSRSSIVIQKRLAAEPQPQAVLSFVKLYLPKFDTINMVQALHLLAVAAKDQEGMKRQMQVDPIFINLFHTTKESIMKDVSGQSPRTIGDILWCCARLNIFDSDLFTELVADATKRLSKFTAISIGLLVFALGSVRQRPRAAFMQALVRELKDRINTEFQPQAVSMIVYGMHRLGTRDERLMKIISEHIVTTAMEYESLTTVTIALAYTKLEYWDDKVFAILGRKVINDLNVMTPREVIMAALAFSKSTEFVRDSTYTMGTLLRSFESTPGRFDDFSVRDLATFSFAVGKFRDIVNKLEEQTLTPENTQKARMDETEIPLVKELISQVQKKKLESFSVAELNLISYSMMRMRHRSEDFLAELAGQFIVSAPEMQEVEIVNAMYGFGRMEYVHVHFVDAMLEEVRRRNLLQTMQTLSIATLAYSMAICRVRDDRILDDIADILIERIREFEPRSVNMAIYALAVLGGVKRFDTCQALVSVVLEDFCTRYSQYEELCASGVLWSCALLGGSTGGLWILKAILMPGFWRRPWTPQQFAMIYYALAPLRVEGGIKCEELSGWFLCRRCYEEATDQFVSEQNQRLSDRLKMMRIPHLANAIPAQKEGYEEAGCRCDIVIEKLSLIIEVEGPQRCTMDVGRVVEERADDYLAGRAEEVLGEARAVVESQMTGSANWKRRLLRQAGWRVVTVTFDENEEYIADALQKMNEPNQGKEGAEPEPEDETGMAEDLTEMDAADQDFLDSADIAQAAAADMNAIQDGLPAMEISFDGEEVTEKEDLSEYEVNLRARHAEAMEELQRRRAARRGDAAAAGAFRTHFDFRRWQAGIEREVFEELATAVAE